MKFKFFTDSGEAQIFEKRDCEEHTLGSIIEEMFSPREQDLVVLLGNDVIWKSTDKADVLVTDILKHGDQLTIYRESSKIYQKFLKIQKNYVNSTDFCAQFFVKTSFIFVEIFVNDKKLKALVDTGAQLSIISKKCAEKCEIFDQLDVRFAVDASGFIGTVRPALGKILNVDLKISGKSMKTILTVIEDLDYEIIIGIDFLTAYNALLDLKNRRITFDDKIVAKFLDE